MNLRDLALLTAAAMPACSSYGPMTFEMSYKVQNDGAYPVEVAARRAGCQGSSIATVLPGTTAEDTFEQECGEYDDQNSKVSLTIVGELTRQKFSLDRALYAPALTGDMLVRLAVLKDPEGELETVEVAGADGDSELAALQEIAPGAKGSLAEFEVPFGTAIYFYGVPEKAAATGILLPPSTIRREGYFYLAYFKTDLNDRKVFAFDKDDVDAICTTDTCVLRGEAP